MSDVLGIFKPDALTIRQIFDGSNYYQIPHYQRPYAWGDEEIEQLWDDLISAFNDGDEYYFLGPVILAQTKDIYVEVVDGQQRLTTLTILFCVLRDIHLKKTKYKTDLLDNLTSNAIKSMVDNKYRLRLITQAQYHIQFENEILKEIEFPINDLSKQEKKKTEFKFQNAVQVLSKKIDDFIDEFGMNKLSQLVLYIFNNVIMITITCSKRVSAIKLFQIINTRGLDLNLADLIKSSLLSRLDDNKKITQFMSIWRDIENIAERNDEALSDLLTYYGYYVIGRKPVKSLYEELEQIFCIKNSNKIAYEFKQFAKSFDEVINEKSKVIYSLRYLRDRVFWKTILTSAKMNRYKKYNNLCKLLQILYYSYWIADYTILKTRNFSFRLIGFTKQKESLTLIKKEIYKKMNDDKIMDYVKEYIQLDVYGESWLKRLLIMIEYAQTDEMMFIDYSKNLHIDHILPEKWKKNTYWKTNWKKENGDEWLNKIGNLTLLSGKKNIKASNHDFPTKKKIYKGKGIDGTTSFEISKPIAYEKKWLLKQVKERQKWMTEQIYNIFNY